MIRCGINGFGRIGRQVLKAIMERHGDTLQVVAINDISHVETNAHLFQYDTNYGHFTGEVSDKERRHHHQRQQDQELCIQGSCADTLGR